jgi:hypothetical protein
VTVVVLKIIGCTNDHNFETIYHYCFSDAGVKNWAFGLGVGSDKNQEVSFIDTSDLTVHEVA